VGGANKKTALMVTTTWTKRVLADRIVMMTNVPKRKLGDILQVPSPDPRAQAVVEPRDYYRLREYLIEFLEIRALPEIAGGSQLRYRPPEKFLCQIPKRF